MLTQPEQLTASLTTAIRALRDAVAVGKLHHATLLLSRSERSAHAVAVATLRAVACATTSASERVAGGCNTCASCKLLAADTHPDLCRLTPDDKGKIRIDVVREATARLALKPTCAPRNMVLIEQADTMNPAAQNALLKTLEEPPGHCCFFMTSARPRALLSTVRSRCQIVRLQPPATAEAWRTLAQAHTDAAPVVVQFLAALAGDDIELSTQLRAQGADAIATRLVACLQAEPSGTAAGAGVGARPGLNASSGIAGDQLLRLAGDLGSTREQAHLAGAMLEVALRDAVARAHGATPDQWLLPDLTMAPLPPHGIVAAAQMLQRWRRMQACNPHPRLALDSILMHLRKVPQTHAATHSHLGGRP